MPIVSLELKKVESRLTDRKLNLRVTEGAKTWLAEAGYDPAYGARYVVSLLFYIHSIGGS